MDDGIAIVEGAGVMGGDMGEDIIVGTGVGTIYSVSSGAAVALPLPSLSPDDDSAAAGIGEWMGTGVADTSDSPLLIVNVPFLAGTVPVL